MTIRVELDPWIEGYLDYLTEVKRNSAGTVRDVRCTLRRVTGMMQSIRPGTALWHLSLEDYARWLELERSAGRSEASLAKHVSHIRGLLEYAWRSGRSDRNVLDGFSLKDRTQRKKPQALTEAEAKRLIAACSRATPLERRDRMIVLLLYGCGLRTAELCQLSMPDVDTERHELRVQGKGDRVRVVPIPEAVFTELLAYLHERGGKRGPLLRTQTKRVRIEAKTVSNAVRRAAEAAGFTRLIVPKMLRHAYATHLMDAGVDLAVIASLMGHRSPTETGVYLHVLGDKSHEAVERLTEDEGGSL
jgi:site-specific recombinase XerD